MRAAVILYAALLSAMSTQAWAAPEPTPPTPPPSAQPQPAAPVIKYENTPENLKLVAETLHAAMVAGDNAKAAAITRDLLPTAERMAKVLRPDAPDYKVDKITMMNAKIASQLGSDETKLAGFLKHKPNLSKVVVSAATTEQIAAKAPEAAAFPGIAASIASTFLKPGVTFYEVEFVDDKSRDGMKFHLFFWDGAKWCMAGQVWRAFN